MNCAINYLFCFDLDDLMGANELPIFAKVMLFQGYFATSLEAMSSFDAF